jgi:hypothetical protein
VRIMSPSPYAQLPRSSYWSKKTGGPICWDGSATTSPTPFPIPCGIRFLRTATRIWRLWMITAWTAMPLQQHLSLMQPGPPIV